MGSEDPLDKFQNALIQTRLVAPDLTVLQLAIFCHVANHSAGSPVQQVDLAQEIGESRILVAKNVKRLSTEVHKNYPGEPLGLIQASPDPTHGKRVLLSLTPKGQRLAHSLKGVFNHDSEGER